MTYFQAQDFHRKRLVSGWRNFRKAQEVLKSIGSFTLVDLVILCDIYDMPIKTTMYWLSEKELITAIPTKVEELYEALTTGGQTLKKLRITEQYMTRCEFILKTLDVKETVVKQ